MGAGTVLKHIPFTELAALFDDGPLPPLVLPQAEAAELPVAVRVAEVAAGLAHGELRGGLVLAGLHGNRALGFTVVHAAIMTVQCDFKGR